MSPSATLSALSPARRRLLRRMHELHFGRIEGLAVRDGDPVFEPPPLCTREVKCAGDNEPRESVAPDFRLKRQVLDLFLELDGVPAPAPRSRRR